MMTPDNPLDDIEAKAGPFADGLGGKKGIENTALDFGRDTGAIVDNFYEHKFRLGGRMNFKDLLTIWDGGHSADGVVDQVGPNLIQLAAVGGNLREMLVELALH